MANYELTLYHTSTEPTTVIRGFDALADAIRAGQPNLDRELGSHRPRRRRQARLPTPQLRRKPRGKHEMRSCEPHNEW
jgi:hypothetical protein